MDARTLPDLSKLVYRQRRSFNFHMKDEVVVRKREILFICDGVNLAGLVRALVGNY